MSNTHDSILIILIPGMEEITAVLLTIIGLAAGYAIAYFMAKTKQSRLEERNANLEKQLHSLRLEMDKEESEASRKLESERTRAQEAEKQLAELSADYRNLKERLTEQKQELQKMEEKFRTEFKNLANEILDEKSKKFTEQNRENMDRLLNPLGEKLEEFKKKVEETYNTEARERNTLKGEITKIFELNQKITEETKNLTRALKGDSKQQGNWGEVILQRILEKSGLSKDREYFIQESHTTDEGRRLQPDVVVKLPDGKHLIIDSKVSLTAYEKFSSAEEKPDQERALKQHITSMRAHVRGLSDKKYHQIYDFKSPDFILMLSRLNQPLAWRCKMRRIYTMRLLIRISLLSVPPHCLPHWPPSRMYGNRSIRIKMRWRLQAGEEPCMINLCSLPKA